MTRGSTVVIMLLAIILFTSLPGHVRAAQTLSTAQPLYTMRDSQVTLVGNGYSNQPYFIWAEGPNDNHTTYTSISFTPVSGGYIPPSVGLPITSQSSIGTYLVSISTSSSDDNSVASAHYGIWGTLKPLYQRTETANILGGGLFAGTSFKVSIRNPAGNYVITSSIIVNSNGDFNYSWRIPVDAVPETYKVLIDGTGTYDNAQQDYVSEAQFSVTPATLYPKISTQPDQSYQRTDLAKLSLSLTYPDGSAVATVLSNAHPIVLLQNQSTVAFASLSLSDQTNGIWGVTTKLPVNATISSKYRFELPAMSFDDGFGNKGGPTDAYTNYFSVNNASLTISSSINGTEIQIPFGAVSIISKISYPDGTPLTANATVSVSVSTGPSKSLLTLSYDPIVGAWRGSYPSSISDLWHVGTWTLKVEATDSYGNSGSASYEISAQPYVFLVIVAVIVSLALVGRWAYARYGRKVYFRTRKLIQRFRRTDQNL
ncbi:MAG: hypothetical protein ABSA92_03500 [Candidatus Bathyarchaeia archaeon]